MNSQQLAEEIARKCAYDHNHNNLGVKETILQSIPLVELLECVQRCKQYQSAIAQVFIAGAWNETNSEQLVNSQQYGARDITNLTTKLKQIGIEV